MASITHLIHRKVVVLHDRSTAVQAAKAMEQHGIGCVLVSDSRSHIVGILTDRDLTCRQIARGGSGTNLIVSMMTPNPVMLDEGAEIGSAIELMEIHGIRRVPVIHTGTGGKQHCIGLISLDDLIVAREIDDYDLMRVVRSQLKRRELGASAYCSQSDLNEPGQSPDYPKSDESLYHGISTTTGLTHEKSKALVQRIASSLVGRLNDTAAVHFIVSLPADLQQDLADTPAGPNPEVSVHSLVNEILVDFGWSQTEAFSYIFQVCRALEEWIGFQRFSHVKAQLNSEFRNLFSATHDLDQEMAA